MSGTMYPWSWSVGPAWTWAAPWRFRRTRTARELSYRGVVCQRSEVSISVAIDGLPDELGEHDAWRLDMAFDEVATQRQRAALEQARVLRGDRAAILRDVLLGRRQPEFGVDRAVGALDRFAQRSAARRRAVRPLGPRRGPDPRPARHRQDDDRRGSHPPGGPPRAEGAGLRPEQPGGR